MTQNTDTPRTGALCKTCDGVGDLGGYDAGGDGPPPCPTCGGTGKEPARVMQRAKPTYEQIERELAEARACSCGANLPGFGSEHEPWCNQRRATGYNRTERRVGR